MVEIVCLLGASCTSGGKWTHNLLTKLFGNRSDAAVYYQPYILGKYPEFLVIESNNLLSFK